MATLQRSNLHVEGINDVHTIKHLLSRHGFKCPTTKDPSSGDGFSDNAPLINAAGGKREVLDAIEPAVRLSNGRSVGFVLDADEVLEDRWQAVRDRLIKFDLDLPDNMPQDGFVDNIPALKVRVGVWLMPDNQRSGALEEFLQDLVDEEDRLYPIAICSTEKAKAEGAGFSDSSKNKAVIHAWLAWQSTPGLPYGAAVKAKYFRDDSPAALAFVEWYKNLFGDG